MKTSQLRSMLRMLECQQDIPHSQRTEWVEGAMHLATNQMDSAMLRQAVKQLKDSRHGRKHPVFLLISPLPDMAFPSGPAPPPSTWETAHLLDVLLLQLRVTARMESVDAANITWAVFTQDQGFFIGNGQKGSGYHLQHPRTNPHHTAEISNPTPAPPGVIPVPIPDGPQPMSRVGTAGQTAVGTNDGRRH